MINTNDVQIVTNIAKVETNAVQKIVSTEDENHVQIIKHYVCFNFDIVAMIFLLVYACVRRKVVF